MSSVSKVIISFISKILMEYENLDIHIEKYIFKSL